MGCGGQTSTTSSTSSPPPQVLAAYGNLLNRGTNVANLPLQQWQGPTIAGFNPTQEAAFSEINQAQGAALPYINAAAQYAGEGAAPVFPNVPTFGNQGTLALGTSGLNLENLASQFGPQDIAQWMNPYTKAVTQATEGLFNEQNAEQLNQVKGNAISQGAFGGDREAVAEAETARQQQLAEAPVLANIQQQGFNTAAGLAQQQAQLEAGIGAQEMGQFAGQQNLALQGLEGDAWRQANAAYQFGNLGTTAENSLLSGAAAQLQAGTLGQELEQQELNVPIAQFQQQQAYPFQSTNFLAGLTEGVGGGFGGTSSTSAPGPNAIGQGAGLGLLTYGIGQNAGWWGGGGAGSIPASVYSQAGADVATNPIFRRGGLVPHREAGGLVPSLSMGDMADIERAVALASASPIPPMGTPQGAKGLPFTAPQSTTTSGGGGNVLGGAMQGAALGTAISPGFGTAAGAVLGALGGLRRGGLVPPHRDAGGLVPDPTMGQSPMTQNLWQRYAQMPAEQLQRLAVALPPGSPHSQMVQRALMQKHMAPASTGAFPSLAGTSLPQGVPLMPPQGYAEGGGTDAPQISFISGKGTGIPIPQMSLSGSGNPETNWAISKGFLPQGYNQPLTTQQQSNLTSAGYAGNMVGPTWGPTMPVGSGAMPGPGSGGSTAPLVTPLPASVTGATPPASAGPATQSDQDMQMVNTALAQAGTGLNPATLMAPAQLARLQQNDPAAWSALFPNGMNPIAGTNKRGGLVPHRATGGGGFPFDDPLADLDDTGMPKGVVAPPANRATAPSAPQGPPPPPAAASATPAFPSTSPQGHWLEGIGAPAETGRKSWLDNPFIAIGAGMLGSRSPFALSQLGEGIATGAHTMQNQERLAAERQRANAPHVDNAGDTLKLVYPDGRIFDTGLGTGQAEQRQETARKNKSDEALRQQQLQQTGAYQQGELAARNRQIDQTGEYQRGELDLRRQALEEGQSPPLSDAAKDAAAKQYRLFGTMPPLSGKSGERDKADILNRAAELDRQGAPGADASPPIPKALVGASGLQWNPARRQWRDSSGKIYGADGNVVPTNKRGGLVPRRDTGGANPPDQWISVDPAQGEGGEFYHSLPPAQRTVAKAMVEGRQPPPTSFAMSKPYWQTLIQAANEIDPTFDQTTWTQRNATAQDFSPKGRSGQAVTAINTLMGHLGVLDRDFDALSNTGGYPFATDVNAVKNWWNSHQGDQAPTNAREGISAVASEARKVFATTGGGGLTELEQWENNFPINGSREQQRGAVRQLISLVDSRLNALAEAHNRGFGRTDEPTALLTPEASTAYAKLTGLAANPATIGPRSERQQPAGAGTPTARTPVPPAFRGEKDGTPLYDAQGRKFVKQGDYLQPAE